jgi:propionyl-CoA carboxylase alpha chain
VSAGMFSKILIANRGEIAVRIAKTAKRMGIKTVQVYSEADADSLAVEMADEAVLIGPPPAAQSYLLMDKIIEAAKQTGAEAIHPGFGFLSERAEFAHRLAAEGLVFIGPNPRAIEAMGDKIESKKFANAAKVSTVPGWLGVIEGVPHAIQIAEEIGYPVMMKASAGGGGKGMRIAWNREEVTEGFPAAQSEAINSFGDGRVFIEKFVTQPRHIEIQVLGDKHGNVVFLNERECSIQRRNQKVIEEAPSPFLTPEVRQRMGEQAVALSKAVDYDSAGTVEFIVDGQQNFFFLEMNTRLQVEHPVTELITGLDLVEQMIRVAAGEELAFAQKDVKLHGWAMESRIYAEDPYRGFLPSIGRLARYQPPVEGEHPGYTVRNDAGVREGDEISMFYDPMISKLCTWAPTRDGAIDGMGRALEDFYIEGLGHNIPFLSAVMDQDRFRSGALTTGYIAEEFPEGFHGLEPTAFQRDLMTAVAASMQETLARRGGGTSARRSEWAVLLGGVNTLVRLSHEGDELTVHLLNEARAVHLKDIDWRPGQALFRGVLDGKPFTATVKRTPQGFQVLHRAAKAEVLVLTPFAADIYARLPKKQAADTSKVVLSPMPGLVVALEVEVGQSVKEGQTVAIIEAMKMQNILRAERDGVVKTVGAKAGDSVAADDVLIEFT